MKAKVRVSVRVKGKKRYFMIKTRAKTKEGLRKATYRHLHKLGYSYINKKTG